MNIKVKTIFSDKRNLFRYWVEFLRPFHKLRPKEIDALALLLYHKHELILKLGDEAAAEELLFSIKVKDQIMKDLDSMPKIVFNNLMSSLRKKGILSKKNTLSEAFMPPMAEGDDGFKLVFNFKLKNDNNKKRKVRNKKNSKKV